MEGRLKIKTKNDTFYCDVIKLHGLDIITDRHEEIPQFQNKITFDLGVAECYDLVAEDVDDIFYIEISELDYKGDYNTDVEIVNTYYDFNSCCLVIEFK
jgi:hypothetical protein